MLKTNEISQQVAAPGHHRPSSQKAFSTKPVKSGQVTQSLYASSSNHELADFSTETLKMKRIRIYESDRDRWDILAERLGCQNESQAEAFHCVLSWIEAQLGEAGGQETSSPWMNETMQVVSQLLQAMTALTTQFQQQQQQQMQLNQTLSQMLQSGSFSERRSSARSPKTQARATRQESFRQMSSQDLKKSHAKGSAEEKLKRAYEAIVAHNEAENREHGEKWAINQNALAELTGCNRPAIKAFLQQYGTEIAAHHQRHRLLTRHNYAHGKVGLKITDAIQW